MWKSKLFIAKYIIKFSKYTNLIILNNFILIIIFKKKFIYYKNEFNNLNILIKKIVKLNNKFYKLVIKIKYYRLNNKAKYYFKY